MRTIPREVFRRGNRNDPVETTRRLLSEATKSELKMYLLGALHDATFNQKHQTYRFSQSLESWLKLLQEILRKLSYRSWIYREGKNRSVWVLETAAKLDRSERSASIKEKVAYIRAYFDTEGGMPRSNRHFLYFQFSQKDKGDLSNIKNWLEVVGIKCGKIHNPSQRIDKNYWRFFVSRMSHWDFMRKISSWHPRKRRQLEFRMKI